jgi:phage baseplate assembly protein V
MARKAWRRFWEGQPHDPYTQGLVEQIGTEEEGKLGFVRVKFPHRGNLLSGWINVGVRKTQDDKDWWIPDVGEMVTCLMDRNYENGTVICAVYSAADAPPSGATVDQRIIQFSDGAVIKYDRSAHALTATLPAGGTASVTAPGGLTVTTANGEINLNGLTIDASGNVNSPGSATFEKEGTFNGGHTVSAHKHGGVQSGGSQTDTPTG